MVTIEIKGLKEVMDIADKYPAISEKHIYAGIQNVFLRLRGEAVKRAPFGTTSELRNNWVIKMGRFQGSMMSGAKSGKEYYGGDVEGGTRPHYVNPNNQDFARWAKNRGLNPYAVSKSIERKGTKANPFFQRSIDTQQDNIDREFEKVLENIIKEI